MGKKGSWFSAIKRVFTSSCQQKPVNEAEKKSVKEKKGGGGNRSFIPLFREPSSIEKILGEVDQQNLFVGLSQQSEAQPSFSGRSLSPPPPPPPPPRVTSPPPHPPPLPRVASPPRAAASPRVVHPQTEVTNRPEPTLDQRRLSATRIQAAYRGYTERRKIRGSTGVVRLQGVIRGQHVKRQTVNAMKQMQLLVRLQTQIQSRRMEMLENQALKRQAETSAGKTELEMDDEDWDDSLITKEEREARLQRKVEAVNKRERAMAYAHSRQLWKGTPKSAQKTLMGYPWWWKWLEREVPLKVTTPSRQKQAADTPPPRPTSLSRSMAPSRTRQQSTTPPSRFKYSKARTGSLSGSPYPMKDDDSLMSCPPFSVPNYMSPTVSAKAKARPTSNPKDRAPGTPASDTSKRRYSFPVTPNSKGRSPRSVGGDSSVDSAFSLGRKPFNRFV